MANQIDKPKLAKKKSLVGYTYNDWFMEFEHHPKWKVSQANHSLVFELKDQVKYTMGKKVKPVKVRITIEEI